MYEAAQLYGRLLLSFPAKNTSYPANLSRIPPETIAPDHYTLLN